MKQSASDQLVIFEMANNHSGSVEHGLRIVEAAAAIVKRHGVRGAVKLQYRDLDTFIHPAFKGRGDVKHIKRFEETRLSRDDFRRLIDAIRAAGLVTVVTPFDEASVGVTLDHGVDILKIASCSALDWPLLGAVASAGRPVICSTGGCSIADVDRIVTFFEHRKVADFSLLHCVGMYPTRNEQQQLNFMRRMIRRYPDRVVGYSGHEAPDNTFVTGLVTAMGARIFERHFGVPTAAVPLNAYSMNPEQADAWVRTIVEARATLGDEAGLKQVQTAERESLQSLMRGAYAKTPIKKGDPLTLDRLAFQMPCQAGQMPASDWWDRMVASRDYAPGEPLRETRMPDDTQIIRSVLHEAKGLLAEAGIAIGGDYTVELSHHYGVDRIRACGAVLVDVVNREYCKKVIVLLPGQRHPEHMHKVKEETFQVLHGEMDLTLCGTRRTLKAGDIQLVRRNEPHSFETSGGVIFEEISTTHVRGDSYYSDPEIARQDPLKRKTRVDAW